LEEPPHVAVALAWSVHACEQLSTTSCRPLVASVSSAELAQPPHVASEANLSDDIVNVPAVCTSTKRSAWSPGTMFETLELNAVGPLAKTMLIVPVAIVFVVDCDAVKVAQALNEMTPKAMSAAPAVMVNL